MHILKSASYDYKDVHLTSQKPSIVMSRQNVKFDRSRIVNAPMLGIVGEDFITSSIQSGMSLCLSRVNYPQEQLRELGLAITAKSNFHSESEIWLSVGLKDWKQRLNLIFDSWSINTLQEFKVKLLLDVANSYSENVKNTVEQIKAYLLEFDLPIYTGNVHSLNGFLYCDFSAGLRVGIGNGSACLTTPHTGIGRGQLTCLQDAALGKKQLLKTTPNPPVIIADGGIREIGDVSKAFAAGADYVMMGYMFAKCHEAACHKKGHKFSGGASKAVKTKTGAVSDRFIEGQQLDIESEYSLANFMQSIEDGVTSSISYCGYSQLTDFIGTGIFELKA